MVQVFLEKLMSKYQKQDRRMNLYIDPISSISPKIILFYIVRWINCVSIIPLKQIKTKNTERCRGCVKFLTRNVASRFSESAWKPLTCFQAGVLLLRLAAAVRSVRRVFSVTASARDRKTCSAADFCFKGTLIFFVRKNLRYIFSAMG